MNESSSSKTPPRFTSCRKTLSASKPAATCTEEPLPWEQTIHNESKTINSPKIREAAKYLGVSPQTVYLWVERKQIPHLRVMGRNIRFLKSDLDSFRASFRQGMENA